MDLEFVCMGVYVGGFQVRTRKQGMTSFGSLADWQIAQVPGTLGSLLGGVIMCLLFVLGGMYVCMCISSLLFQLSRKSEVYPIGIDHRS